MILISLVFLFVYLFGAYAYGAATVLSVRAGRARSGAAVDETTPPGVRRRIDKASLGAVRDQHRLVRAAHR